MTITKKYFAPAKVNLFLKIKGKREDGYHELITLMAAVSLYDELTISVEDLSGEKSVISVETDDPSIGAAKDNLCYKAAELFLNHANITKSVKINLKKSIPHGAGLGGGSSDGASTLMALNELTNQNIAEKDLLSLASQLGSDVPFFILKSPAVATGRGEKLKKTTLCELNLIIIKPKFSVNTKSAYDGLDLTKTAENNTLLPFSSTQNHRITEPKEAVLLLSNDFQDGIIANHQRIGEILQVLKDFDALGSLMSGSGSSVFGVFEDAQAAKDDFEKVTSFLQEGERAFLVKTLS